MKTKQFNGSLLLKRVMMARSVINYLLLIAIAGTVAIFGLLEPKFLTVQNFITIVTQTAPMGILALGLTFVLAVGEMDFAAGSEYTIGACTISLLLSVRGFHNYWLALLLTLAAMAVMGICNAFLHAVIGIPSFIATLGMSTFITGVYKYGTKASPIYSMKWPKTYTLFGQGYLFGKIPIAAVLLVCIVILCIYLMENTVMGRHIYAVGGNPTAAKNVGININRTKFIAFILCALLCGFAGIVRCSMTNQANSLMGENMLMQGMSCAMLGATFYKVGSFNAIGTATAALLISIIQNGLTMIGAETWTKDYFYGAVLLIAVSIISFMRLKLMPSSK